ncbi:MAG: glycosyltransferase family 9 protein [Desulfuromonadaceae bacterium]|nr:glycosyltransferase family 9 protein [Desulfuromonadaceae bacterium]
MASHLAEGLRIKFPEAQISWLAEPQVAPLLEHNPALNSVIVWPKMHWKKMLRSIQLIKLYTEVKDFIAKLRDNRFTMTIDAQGLLRTRVLAWLSSAPQRIGFDSREPGQSLMTKLIQSGDNTHQIGSEYFYLLEQLGINTAGLRQSLYLDQVSYIAAANQLVTAGISGSYVVFAPFTTRPQKHWFEQQWIELAQEVSKILLLQIVWLGGPGDKEAAESLAHKGGGISLAGKTDLSTSAAIISKAALMVGVDTGLTHMGTAFLIPTIALFGSTCPYTATRNPHTVILYHQLSCSPCRRKPACDGKHDCMRAITVAEVMQTIRRMEISRRTT